MNKETMRAARKRLKFSQRQLGEALGYTQEQIGNIERGISPVPKWMAYALAWLHNYGERTPFDEA